MNQTENKEELIKNLILQAKNGKSQAFDSLYEMFYQPLFKFVMYKTGNKDISLDICQDTFLAWYKSLDNYFLDIKIENYLFFIAKRLIINQSKKKIISELPEEMEEIIFDVTQKSIEEELDSQINFENIHKSFEILSESEKDILTLKYISDRNNSEIAQITGKTESNIRQIEHRAIKKLKSNLKNPY